MENNVIYLMTEDGVQHPKAMYAGELCADYALYLYWAQSLCKCDYLNLANRRKYNEKRQLSKTGRSAMLMTDEGVYICLATKDNARDAKVGTDSSKLDYEPNYPTENEHIKKLEAIAIEMQQIYYANERDMDAHFNAERLGLDNVTGNLSLHELYWHIQDNDMDALGDAVSETEDFFKDVERLADNKGYGPGAASRGFDVTRPIGRYWTLASMGLHHCEKLREQYELKKAA